MRTNIVIDDELMNEALRVTGVKHLGLRSVLTET
ncbi:type II toxin-antitoxin system VapB family antitoxin [Zoogloea sp.]